MKLISAILSFFLFSNIFALSNTAPEQEISLRDSTVTYDASWAKISKQTYFYDNTTKVKLSSVGFLFQNNTWLQNADTEFSYDEAGRLTVEEGSFLDPLTQILVRAYKYEISYDAAGNISAEEYYTKEVGQTDWTGSSKYSYTYYSGIIKEVFTYIWNSQVSAWIFDKKYVYNYDQNNNEILFESYDYDQSVRIWKTELKSEKTYSLSNNKLLSEIYYSDNNNKNSWLTTAKSEYTYDANGQIMEKNIYRSENGTDWKNNTKTTYAYSTDKLITSADVIWNDTKKIWINSVKEEYGYLSGILASKMTNIWNQKNSVWTLILQKEFTHPDGGFDETTYSYTPSGIKVGISRSYYLNTGIGKPSVKRQYGWDEKTDQWYTSNEERYEYTQNNKISVVEKWTGTEDNNTNRFFKDIYEYNAEDNLANEFIYSWNTSNDSWQKEKNIVHYYHGTSGIENNDHNDSQFQIRILTKDNALYIISESRPSSVFIYNMTGKLIYHGIEEKISTSVWNGGAYIVNVTTENGSHRSEKILIK